MTKEIFPGSGRFFGWSTVLESPVCPHCCHPNSEWLDRTTLRPSNGDVRDVECDSCGESFEVRVSMSVSFQVRR